MSGLVDSSGNPLDSRGAAAIVGPTGDSLDVGEDFLSKRGEKLLGDYCCAFQRRCLDDDNVMIHGLAIETLVDAAGVPPYIAIEAEEEYDYVSPMKLLAFEVRLGITKRPDNTDHQLAVIHLARARQFTQAQDEGFIKGIEEAKIKSKARKILKTPDPAA